MDKIKIKVYSKLNGIEENNEFNAIKKNSVIEYIDLENNKMMVDMDNDIIHRENIDYCFKIDFINNKTNIEINKLHKCIQLNIC